VEWRLSPAKKFVTQSPSVKEFTHTHLKRNSSKSIVQTTAKGRANGEREIVSLTLSTMTREQYVQRSKESALALLRVGRISEAVASMIMDMRKHPDCGVHPEINAIGIFAATAGDAGVARAFIDGF
jgi:hypothetical protein